MNLTSNCVCTNRIPVVCAICDMLKREYISPNIIKTKQAWRETYWSMLNLIPHDQPFDIEFQLVCYQLEEPPLHLAEEDPNDRPRE